MVRRDYEKGSFPIGSRSPVMCYAKDGPLYIAYDNYTLKKILNQSDIIKCVGVWPGKITTDIFPLGVEYYKDMPVPPKEYKNIDSATDIQISVDKGVKRVEYFIMDTRTENSFKSTDKSLIEYITLARPHKVIITE